MPRRSVEEKRARQASARQHELLMVKVEWMIARIYAVKEKHPHQIIWFLTASLEVFKRQAALAYRILKTEKLTERDLPDFEALGKEINESLTNICDLAQPILKPL